MMSRTSSRHSSQSRQSESDDDDEPLKRDICFNSPEQWPGTGAFFRAVRKAEKEFDEWEPNVTTHVKQQLLARRFFTWVEDDEFSAGGFYKKMTNKQVNVRIKKEFNCSNKGDRSVKGSASRKSSVTASSTKKKKKGAALKTMKSKKEQEEKSLETSAPKRTTSVVSKDTAEEDDWVSE